MSQDSLVSVCGSILDQEDYLSHLEKGHEATAEFNRLQETHLLPQIRPENPLQVLSEPWCSDKPSGLYHTITLFESFKGTVLCSLATVCLLQGRPTALTGWRSLKSPCQMVKALSWTSAASSSGNFCRSHVHRCPFNNSIITSGHGQVTPITVSAITASSPSSFCLESDRGEGDPPTLHPTPTSMLGGTPLEQVLLVAFGAGLL